MSDTDPRNHPDPQMREVGQKLYQNSKATTKITTTPSNELDPIPTHIKLLGLAKEKDALLADAQRLDPTWRTAEVAHGRKGAQGDIAYEEQALHAAGIHLPD